MLRPVASTAWTFRRAGGPHLPPKRRLFPFRSCLPLRQPDRAFALPTAHRCLYLRLARIFAQEGLRQHPIGAVIPTRKDQPRDETFDQGTYRRRSRIEQVIGWYKECRALGTR